jgi:hypothetical protein
MAITYHAGRRIQGLSTEVLETVTFEYNMATDPRTNTFNVNTSYSTITYTGSTIQYTATSGTGESGGSLTYIDLGSSLSNKFVIRYKNSPSGTQSYLANSHNLFGISSVAPTTTSHIASTNWIGTRWYFGTQWGSSANKQGFEPRIAQNSSSGNHNNATGVDRLYGRPDEGTNANGTFYHELIWNVDTLTLNVYDNVNYTGTPLATAELSSSSNTQWVTGTPSSVTGLRYLVYYQANDHQLGTFNFELDDIEIYDGVSSLTSKPTNVQVGSRFEETDTRKMYHKDDIDWKEENDGNIPNFRSASWYEQLSGETP